MGRFYWAFMWLEIGRVGYYYGLRNISHRLKNFCISVSLEISCFESPIATPGVAVYKYGASPFVLTGCLKDTEVGWTGRQASSKGGIILLPPYLMFTSDDKSEVLVVFG